MIFVKNTFRVKPCFLIGTPNVLWSCFFMKKIYPSSNTLETYNNTVLMLK